MARRSSVFHLGLVLSLGLTLTLLSACGLPKAEKNGKNQAISKIDIAPINKGDTFTGYEFIAYADDYLPKIFDNNIYYTHYYKLGSLTNGIWYGLATINEGEFNGTNFNEELFFGTSATLNSAGKLLETKALVILASKDNTGIYTYYGVLYCNGSEFRLQNKSDFIRLKNNGDVAQMMLAYNYNGPTAIEVADFVNGLTTKRDRKIQSSGSTPNNSLASLIRQAIENNTLSIDENKLSLLNRQLAIGSLAKGSINKINDDLAENNHERIISDLNFDDLFDAGVSYQLYLPDSKSSSLKKTILIKKGEDNYLLLGLQGPLDNYSITKDKIKLPVNGIKLNNKSNTFSAK